jgi:GTP-binding protein
VINKIDKPAANPEQAQELVYELFLDLGATDEQLNFVTVYAIGKQGIAKRNLADTSADMSPLLDVVLENVPAASSDALNEKPLRMQPFNLGYDNYVGRLAVGRIYEGMLRAGQNVVVKKPDGSTRTGKISKLYSFEGLKKVEVTEAMAGDIVMVAGLPDIYIGETICVNVDQEALPAIHIDEPTISLNFLVNNSPYAGKEGKYVTTRQIRERLEKELEVNVGLQIDFADADHFKVYGRGELHIAILLENLRREGFELQVSQPHVILKEENGQTTEPFEEVLVNVPENLTGVVIEKLSKRKGLMTNMKPEHGSTRLVFEIPTRGLLGYRGEFTIDTRGEGILCSRFVGFRPHVGVIERHDVGSMISMVQGETAAFALDNLQTRGVLYVGPGVPVYEGMVVVNTSKGDDMTVNPIKGKQLTNMRTKASDDAIILAPAFELSLERALEVMKEDEYLEVTPKSVRLRKQYLNETERAKARNKTTK